MSAHAARPDEPAANLDEANAYSIAEALVRLASGRTTLLIVHHQALAEYADRVLTLEAGRLAPVLDVAEPSAVRAMEAVA